jgi:hypothetical protein
MVPAALSLGGGRRGARIPPHSRHAARRTPGLEAAIVDHAPMKIAALDPADLREVTLAVAGPAALIVAKLHKIAERGDDHDRLLDKDAYDVYRLLVATPTAALAASFRCLVADEIAGPATTDAIGYLANLYADPTALGAMMVARAEELVGNPPVAGASAAILAGDVLEKLA